MTEQYKSASDPHVARKIFHSVSILGILCCMIFLPKAVNWTIYCLIGLPLVMADFLRQTRPALNNFFIKIMKPVMRTHEVKEVSGSSWAILGIGLSYLLFKPQIAQLAVLFLALGDPVASYFGIQFGRWRFWAQKSEAGLIAGTTICTIAALVFFYFQDGHFTPGLAICCGVIGGLAESFVIGSLDDNLTQPLISGALVQGLLSTGVF